jgi:hypothetical protein
MSAASFWQRDPFRTVAWRWERAQQLSLGDRGDPFEDPDVLVISQYQIALVTGTTDIPGVFVQERWPDLFAAHAIHYSGSQRDEVEARLLAGEPFVDISRKTNVPESVLGTYASTFFDILGSLFATTWLMTQAIGIDAWRDRPPTDADVLKYLGVAAGPFMIDALLGQDGQPPEVREQLWQKARLAVRGLAASMWPRFYDLAAILAEEQKVFRDVIDRECVRNSNRLLAYQLNFVRGVNNMPPLLGIGADPEPGKKQKPERPAHNESVVAGESVSEYVAAQVRRGGH